MLINIPKKGMMKTEELFGELLCSSKSSYINGSLRSMRLLWLVKKKLSVQLLDEMLGSIFKVFNKK